MTSEPPNFPEFYDEYYFRHGCGPHPYERTEAWLDLFAQVAERIILDVAPKKVLDVGCAMGMLVEALRDRQVEAFGIDISSYALQQVREDMKPFCRLGSLLDPLTDKYDFVVCIEVLEHLLPSQAERAVTNICQASDDVLFSSTPHDFKEATHSNVRPPDYWAGLFARQNFFRDTDYDASFLTPWAVRFRKSKEPLHRIILRYERRFWDLFQENISRKELTVEQRNQLVQQENEIQEVHKRLSVLQAEKQDLEKTFQPQKESLKSLQDHILMSQERLETIQLLKQEISIHQNRIQHLDELLLQKDQTLRHLRHKILPDIFVSQRTKEESLQGHILGLTNQLIEAHDFLREIQQTLGWSLLQKLRRVRSRMAPPGSTRDTFLNRSVSRWRSFRQSRTQEMIMGSPSSCETITDVSSPKQGITREIIIEEIRKQSPVNPHRVNVDIVICIHNAANEVQQCLNSLIQNTSSPYNLVLIDDGSNQETQRLLEKFASSHKAVLIRNKEPLGYTRAANLGLKQSDAEFVLLLNSDTVVTAGWLDRLVACAESNPRIGLVGPLSNTASWQSIPDIEFEGDWAENPLPKNISIEEMGDRISRYSGQLYPVVPLLNGFCMLIRKSLIQQIGYFDELNFGEGYGEENDLVLRASKAGWLLAVADDTFVFHHQSRSYSHEKRQQLCERADKALTAKHGAEIIKQGVYGCRYDKVLEGIRARSKYMNEREEILEKGRAEFKGKRLCFILPIQDPGGGANVVLTEARFMVRMGVEVRFFNLDIYRDAFQKAYPDLEIPSHYGKLEELKRVVQTSDALVSTVNFSVSWIKSLGLDRAPSIKKGYYIQDFEVLFYPTGTKEFQTAWNSYSLLPDLIRFTKTEWTCSQVERYMDVSCFSVGPSVDIDLFQPRPWEDRYSSTRPIRIAAMIRPSTPRRAPRITMEVLRRISLKYGGKVEILLFGTTAKDPRFQEYPLDFQWKMAGVLNPRQMAELLNQVDIFVDFSSYQAMGLTALEAMACGVAVIVPREGGAGSFVQDRGNALMVDTSSPFVCEAALTQLIEDKILRDRLQHRAIFDACAYSPEASAYKILKVLFTGQHLANEST